MAQKKAVEIYTDGSCLGNPGPGGYGAVLVCGEREKELSGGFGPTTNNRMELLAAIEGLAALTLPCKVTLYSDSQYVVRAMRQGWALGWRNNGWRRGRSGKHAAANPDLWERLLGLCEDHEVEFVWVKGHSGHPMNERCDRLAVAAANRPGLPPDTGYGAQA